MNLTPGAPGEKPDELAAVQTHKPDTQPDRQHAVVDVPDRQEPLFVLPELPWTDGDPEGETSRRWKRMQTARIKSWTRTVTEYRKTPTNLYWSYWLLNNHPVFWTFSAPPVHEATLIAGDGVRTGLRYEVSLADMRPYGFPDVETAVRTLIHTTAWPPASGSRRSLTLDGVSHGFDQAIVEAARLVVDRFGFDRRRLDGVPAIVDYLNPKATN